MRETIGLAWLIFAALNDALIYIYSILNELEAWDGRLVGAVPALQILALIEAFVRTHWNSHPEQPV